MKVFVTVLLLFAVAVRQRQLLSVDAGEMMHATIHAGNTSKRNVVIGAGWQEISESGLFLQ